MPFCVTRKDILRAAEYLQPHIHRTPIHTSRTLDSLCGSRLFLKCENLQRIGAFKIRGATYAIGQLSEELARCGVVTQSSGNHGQAVALAAQERNISAHIVMPSNASRVKREAVKSYGGQVVECEPTLAAREAAAEQLLKAHQATYIHPYDNVHVIAGQGTTGIEVMEQVSHLDAIVTPVGGGGLLSGVCIAASESTIKVYGAEPKGADDAYQSYQSGLWQPQDNPQTVADGLLTSLGQTNWPIIRQLCAGIFTVTEEQIIEAMRFVWERMKLLIEPSSAVAVAVVSTPEFKALGHKRVCVVVTGGNVDLDKIPWV